MNGIHRIIRSCHSMTRLISEAQERELKPLEKVQMSLHTGMCPGCRNFSKNTRFLRQTMQAFRNREESQ